MGERGTELLERLRGWRRAVEFLLARRFGLATPEDRTFFLLIAVVGVIAGVLGALVHRLIDLFQWLLWGSGDLLTAAATAPRWVVVAAPALGGLVVGVIFLASRGSGRGAGMSLLIEAVLLHGGRIPARPVLTNAVAAVVTVGAGGSLGREGPMIRLGAMISTWLGSRFGLAPHRIKVLLGCGAAAGLAAAYNVPIGGALFAMEVILGNFALEIFGPIVASSVISTLIARGMSGNLPRYGGLEYRLESGWEIFAYVGLGLLGALASVLFVRGVRSGRKVFDALPLPTWLQPALGMAMLGCVALILPQVLGGGHDSIQAALGGQLALDMLLFLAVGKLLATALTAGSGNAGGLFTPSLFFGALVGGAYGTLIHGLWPEATAGPGAYAAVGMAALTAGTSHAPISAILILFELTGDYELILPLMVASIVSSIVSRRLHRYSMYTESLERRGIDTSMRMEQAVLAGLEVRDLVRQDPDSLAPRDGYSQVVERFFATHRQRLFVVGAERQLLGAVSLHDIKHALDDPARLTMVLAHDLAAPVEQVLRDTDRLHHAAEAFARSDYERLPVLDPEGRYLGVLAKRDLLAIYTQEVLGRPALLATFVSGSGDAMRRDYVELPPDFALRLVSLPPELAGRTLADASLPQRLGVRVLEIQRRGPHGEPRRVIPDAATRLEAGDDLVILGPEDVVERVEKGEVVLDDEAALHEAIN
ncbi:MAG TPA: chloride channel protein [Thermoanaerobaculia bacterium]|nr:chloride channel protein [Thermoanaerobaculia bacterium]